MVYAFNTLLLNVPQLKNVISALFVYFLSLKFQYILYKNLYLRVNYFAHVGVGLLLCVLLIFMCVFYVSVYL